MAPLVDLEIAGTGPAVLLLHGTPTPWDVLRPVSDALVGNQTLLAALPGNGSAPRWPDRILEGDICERPGATRASNGPWTPA